jgi:hypothetical protein
MWLKRLEWLKSRCLTMIYIKHRPSWAVLEHHFEHWLDSNFIPLDSQKFEFRNFDYIIRFEIKNESEIEKLRSRDRRIFEKNRFYEIETFKVFRIHRNKVWIQPLFGAFFWPKHFETRKNALSFNYNPPKVVLGKWFWGIFSRNFLIMIAQHAQYIAPAWYPSLGMTTSLSKKY